MMMMMIAIINFKLFYLVIILRVVLIRPLKRRKSLLDFSACKCVTDGSI
jgi:hypothetical protein